MESLGREGDPRLFGKQEPISDGPVSITEFSAKYKVQTL